MTNSMLAGAQAPAAGLAPGVYPDLPAETYHADPALSSTGARTLVRPGGPARYQWEREHGREPTAALETGQAAHLAVLGAGPDLVVVDASDWRSTAAREQRQAARAAGAVPLLVAEYDRVQAMAAAIRRHPVAGPLFAPGTGRAEVSGVWRDEPSGVVCRVRFDWLREAAPGRRLVIPDYKTCHSADPAAFARSVAEYGYEQQADWYTTGAQRLGLAPDGAVMVFVCQEKRPPYLVATYALDMTALRIGAAKNRRAIDTFRDCQASGRWPGYADDVAYLSLPPWAEIRDTEEYL